MYHNVCYNSYNGYQLLVSPLQIDTYSEVLDYDEEKEYMKPTLQGLMKDGSHNVYNFYSYEDLKFRFVRNYFLTKDEYENNMIRLMKETTIDIENTKLKLFFDKKDLLLLDKLGHTIGLHSHNHPTTIEKLSYKEQKLEYSTNLSVLNKILKKISI